MQICFVPPAGPTHVLGKIGERGRIRVAIVDGPLAFDTAVSAQLPSDLEHVRGQSRFVTRPRSLCASVPIQPKKLREVRAILLAHTDHLRRYRACVRWLEDLHEASRCRAGVEEAALTAIK